MSLLSILKNYSNESPSIRKKLFQLLSYGELSGTGRLVILPVDQGFEHGPIASFETNPSAYDPVYHHDLAVEAGLSAIAAPYGFLSQLPSTSNLPMILKMNGSNLLKPSNSSPKSSFYSSVDDALYLGALGIGLTIYPGSAKMDDQLYEVKEVIREAKRKGLVVVIWSYPRGKDLTKEDETALDVVAYAAHIASMLGAHIVKIKLPSDHIKSSGSELQGMSLNERLKYINKSLFSGQKIVLFSGNKKKDENALLKEIDNIARFTSGGSILGRNIFQRERKEALNLLKKILEIYKKNPV